MPIDRLRLALGDGASLRRTLITATFSSGWVWLAGAAATFLVGVIMARGLGPANYGIYGTAVAIATLLGVPAQMGLPPLATRDFAAAEGRGDAAGQWQMLRWFVALVLASGLIATALMAGLAALLAGREIAPSQATALELGALLVPGAALAALASAMLRGTGAVVMGQAIDALVRPTLFAAALGVALVVSTGLIVESALLAQIVATALAALIGLALVVRRLPRAGGQRSRPPLRLWAAAALPMAASEAMRILDGTYGVLLASVLATPTEAGLYRVSTACLALVVMPISIQHLVVAPFIARAHAEGAGARVQRIVRGSAIFMTACVATMTIGFAVIGDRALALAFGPAFVPAYTPLLILCVAQLVSAMSGPGATLLAMTGREQALARHFGASVLVAIAVAAALTGRMGADGTALGALAGMAVRALLINRDARASLGIAPSVLTVLRRPAAA